MAKDKDEDRKSKKNKEKGKKDKKKNKGSPIGASVEFGVNALAKYMKLEPASVRVKLRDADIKRKGGQYDFEDEAGVRKMAKKLAA